MPHSRTSGFPFLFLLVLLFAPAGATSAYSQDAISGVVVDAGGGVIPRAYVRLIAPDGATLAQTIADGRGAFRFTHGACARCRIEAALGGFEPASVDVDTSPLVLALAVGPIAEAVVVSATRGEAPVSQIGSAITVFDAEDIERRGTPLLGELLRGTAGATVVRSGGLGNVTSLFVRGGESNYNKVLLDGIPLNEPGGTFNFSNITTEHLDRVEVVRGAHSALFGSDAMASVVQLVTKRASRPALAGSIEAGTYDSQRGSVSGGTARGRLDVAAHLSRQHTSNRAPNNEFRNTTWSVNGGAQLSPDTSIRIVGRGEIGRTGVPGATAFGRPDSDAFFARRENVAGMTLRHLRGAWQQRATYALTMSYHESTNLGIDAPYTPEFEGRRAPFAFSDFPYDSETDLRRHHASYQADWRLDTGGAGAHLLTAALDWDGERGVLGNRLAGTDVRAERDNVGGAFQHQALWRRMAMTTGLRVERNGSFGTEIAPRLSLVVMLREDAGLFGDTRLKANAGTGVKEPTITQSFSPSPSFLGNPDLEPERARTLDAGIEQRLFERRVKVELVGFYGRFENIISTRTTSFTPFRAQYFNIGLTHASGTELTGEVAARGGLRMSAGHTFLASEVTRSTAPTNAVFAEGRWLFRRPRHSGFVNVSWARANTTVDLHGTFVGERVDSDFSALAPPILSNEGYATWDLGASYRAWRRVTWFARVENLGDAEYMDPVGYPAWRRAGRLGVRVGF
jgi:vitamin B12 transporter